MRCSSARSVASTPCFRHAAEQYRASGAADEGIVRPHDAHVRSACSASFAAASASVLIARPMPSSSSRGPCPFPAPARPAQVRLAASER